MGVREVTTTSMRAVLGLGIGAVTAVGTFLTLAVAGIVLAPTLVWPRGRATALRLAATWPVWMAGLERRRLVRLLGDREAAAYPHVTADRAWAYLGLRWPIGLLGGGILLLFGYGGGTVAVVTWLWLRGEAPDGIEPSPLILGYFVVSATVLGFLGVQGLIGVVRLERRLARRLLGPTATDALRRRIEELATSRAEVVAAVDAERRRIERDLHDGVQQRLVALGMLLGRSRRSSAAGDPVRADEFVARAHRECQEILDELREVAWRVYPSALDTLGLADALARVAERSSVPVSVHYGLRARPPALVEAAAYFVVSEAITNAAKHAAATAVTVRVTQAEGTMTVRVTDDGTGGADPAGPGLTGLARRVAALDGRLRVTSPAGGPTTVTAELPCG